MNHPGTFNANPLSAAAGIATLQLVADGEPCRRANATAQQLRQRLNAAVRRARRSLGGLRRVLRLQTAARLQGPRPAGDDFIPYGGALDKLDGAEDAELPHAFRQGMLLHGVDLPGLAGMTTAAHTEADIELTVAAVAGTLDLLREEGLT